MESIENLEYYSYDKDELDLPTRGFWSQAHGPLIMAGMVEFLKINDIEHEVHDEMFQLKFNYVEKAEKFECEEESSEEELEIPDQEVSIKIKLYEDEEENEEENKKVFVKIYRTSGTAVTFGNFMRKFMNEETGVSMFSDK